MTELNGEMLTILGASIFVVALLYSCVGHGGASGYIAVMALAGMAPAVLKPTALVLNIRCRRSRLWPSPGPDTFPGGFSGRSP